MAPSPISTPRSRSRASSRRDEAAILAMSMRRTRLLPAALPLVRRARAGAAATERTHRPLRRWTCAGSSRGTRRSRASRPSSASSPATCRRAASASSAARTSMRCAASKVTLGFGGNVVFGRRQPHARTSWTRPASRSCRRRRRPTVRRHFTIHLAGDLAQFRPPQRLELHQRRDVSGARSCTWIARTQPASGAPYRKTLNYGGGARWFTSDHLAFSVDFRWYSVAEQPASAGLHRSAANDPARPQRRHLDQVARGARCEVRGRVTAYSSSGTRWSAATRRPRPCRSRRSTPGLSGNRGPRLP